MTDVADWVSLLGGTTVVIGVVGGGLYWVLQRLINHRLATALEEQKQVLNRATQEHVHRAAKLHERRIEKIEEVYGTLSKAFFAVRVAVGIHEVVETKLADPNESGDVGLRNAAADAMADFGAIFNRNRIYFSSAMCQRIDGFLSEGLVALAGGVLWERTSSREIHGALKTFLIGATEVKLAIETDFRRLLGVDDAPVEEPARSTENGGAPPGPRALSVPRPSGDQRAHL
jgi:hypothetical protein